MQDTAASTAETHASEQQDAMAKIEELTDKVSSWQSEHATAVERGDSLEAKAKEDIDNFTSQLEQLRAELSAEQEGRSSDASKAAVVAEGLNATIQRLQHDLSDGDAAREQLLKEAARWHFRKLFDLFGLRCCRHVFDCFFFW